MLPLYGQVFFEHISLSLKDLFSLQNPNIFNITAVQQLFIL